MDIMDTEAGRAWVQLVRGGGRGAAAVAGAAERVRHLRRARPGGRGEWGNAHADYVMVRDPMLIAAFTQLFDRAFDRALPVVPDDERDDDDLRLLRLLGLGLKDESIARYLGCSLRTVRRRVAGLMARHGVQTRFQLGLAAPRGGLGSPAGARTGSLSRYGPRANTRGLLHDQRDRRTDADTERCGYAGNRARGRPVGRRGQGQGHRPDGQRRRLRREVQRRQQRRPHHRHREGRQAREVRAAPAALGHPHADLHPGHRQRRRRRPGRALRGARRPRGPRRRHLPAAGQRQRPHHRALQPRPRQGDRALPRARARSAPPAAASARPTPTRWRATASACRTSSTRRSCARRSRPRWPSRTRSSPRSTTAARSRSTR